MTAALKGPVIEVIDLLSDDESISLRDGDAQQVLVNVDSAKLDAIDTTDIDDRSIDSEDWEAESLYEDALEGMGDEQLIEGGIVVLAHKAYPQTS